MTFEEFLAYIRENIGNRCTDSYWRTRYNQLEDKSKEGIEDELRSLKMMSSINSRGCKDD